MIDKNISIIIIIVGFLLLILSIKQFLNVYSLYIQKEIKKSYLYSASFAIFTSFVFLGGGIIWLLMIYQ